MDEFTEKITSMLGQDGMKKLGEMAKTLGLDPGLGDRSGDSGQGTRENDSKAAPSAPPGGSAPPDLSAMAGMLGSMLGQNSGGASDGKSGGIDPATLLQLSGAMRQMNTETEETKLLEALRPHLRTDRQSRIDEAIGLMRVLSLLPTLRDGGLLQGLFGK